MTSGLLILVGETVSDRVSPAGMGSNVALPADSAIRTGLTKGGLPGADVGLRLEDTSVADFLPGTESSIKKQTGVCIMHRFALHGTVVCNWRR